MPVRLRSADSRLLIQLRALFEEEITLSSSLE